MQVFFKCSLAIDYRQKSMTNEYRRLLELSMMNISGLKKFNFLLSQKDTLGLFC